VWQFVEDKDANFGILTQEAFEYFLQSKEIQKVEFEKEQEQIRIENQKLREEAEKKEADAKKEREAQEAAMAKERKKAQEAAEKERKEKEALEAQLKKERDEKAAEEAKKQAELEKERLRLENLSKAGDKAILLDWINASFPTPKSPNGLTSDGNGKLLEIAQKFDGFKKWALTQIES
jgi:ATPase subunit of ABC transporter with duplicated ATPase domains